jgi:uncharacterized protein (DUF2141 family)
MKPRYLLYVFLFPVIAVFFTTCEKDEKTNSQPIIQSVTVSPNTINAGGMVNITVVAADSDKDSLSYTYVVTGGSISGTGPSVSWTAPSAEGAHSVNVTVRDGKGGEATQNASLTVLKPVTQVTGTASFVAGVSGDLSNAKVSLYTTRESFELNQPVRFVAVNGNGGSVTFTIPNVLPGSYYLSVWKDNNNSTKIDDLDYFGVYGQISNDGFNLTEVEVKEGQSVTCTVDMIILELNTDPVISDFVINPTKVCLQQRAQIQVTASDADNNPLSYLYEVTGGMIIGEGNSVMWEAPGVTGIYTIKVTVNDNKGGVAMATKTIEVIVPNAKIIGTAKFKTGNTGNLENAMANLYLTREDWAEHHPKPIKQVKVSGYGEKVTFVLKDICPGTYFADVWKDNDGSGTWSIGDYFGIYGNLDKGIEGLTEIIIGEGQTLTIHVDVIHFE